jgi:hypothetical protein
MPRNLIVCCDGTGNIWDSDYDTNVVKLTRVLEKSNEQIVFYDPGVGSSNIYPSIGLLNRFKSYTSQLTGLALGGGLYENVGEAYGFLVQHYQPEDRLFFFGFSRGAFTVRSVAGMVNWFGIVRRGAEAMIPTLTRLYFQPEDQRSRSGKRRDDYAKDIRQVFALEGRDAPIHFMGVWDTVCTVGGIPLFKKTMTSAPSVEGKRYHHVRHAVALDEYRDAYQPRLYRDRHLNYDDGDRSMKQLWFTGAHSDVGGSYKEDGLSNCSLRWMLDEAIAKGLRCDRQKVNEIVANPTDLAHDQVYSQPLWALTGLEMRQPPPDELLHDSVKKRRAAGSVVQTCWSPWYRNRWLLGSFAGVLLLVGALKWIKKLACRSEDCPELSRMFVETFLSGNSVSDMLLLLDRRWATSWYAVDYLFILFYTMAICVTIVYLRKALADRTQSGAIHGAAYWAGLVPIWTLIGSDILENALSLWLLYHPTLCTTDGWLCWVLIFFTSLKYFAIGAVLLVLIGWLLYCVRNRKPEPFARGQMDFREKGAT